jgi:hypothetical protein
VTRTSGNCSRNGRHQPYHHPRHSQLVTSHVHGPISPLAFRPSVTQAPVTCVHHAPILGVSRRPDLYSPGTTLGRSAPSRPATFRRRKERTRREKRSRPFAVTRRLRGSCRRGSARPDTSGANPQCSYPRPGPGISYNPNLSPSSGHPVVLAPHINHSPFFTLLLHSLHLTVYSSSIVPSPPPLQPALRWLPAAISLTSYPHIIHVSSSPSPFAY